MIRPKRVLRGRRPHSPVSDLMSTDAKPHPAAVTTAYSAVVTPRSVRSRATGDLVMRTSWTGPPDDRWAVGCGDSGPARGVRRAAVPGLGTQGSDRPLWRDTGRFTRRAEPRRSRPPGVRLRPGRRRAAGTDPEAPPPSPRPRGPSPRPARASAGEGRRRGVAWPPRPTP